MEAGAGEEGTFPGAIATSLVSARVEQPPPLAIALATALAVSACGGGDDGLASERLLAGPPQPAPEGFALAGSSSESRRRALALIALRIPTIDQLFDWAQRTYPGYFPGSPLTQSFEDIQYRAYSSGNYLGVRGTEVLVLGPVSDGQLLTVGRLADFPQAAVARFVPSSDSAAVRFLLQAQFSASDEEIAEVRNEGYEGWLARQLEIARGTTAVGWMLAQAYDKIDSRHLYFESSDIADRALWHQLFNSPETVRMRAALALSEFFCASTDGLFWWQGSFGVADYWDLLCSHAFGNFRALLEAVSLHPVIGINLNTRGNEKENPATGRVPDENYAREVMQLFTIGLYELNLDGTPKIDGQGRPIETYGNSDVVNLARVFTGYDQDWSDISWTLLPELIGLPERGVYDYRVAARPMVNDPQKHSQLEKRFLGRVIPAGTDAPTSLRLALDTLFAHPNVGPFFARQMIQRLVTSHPSPAYVARVARVFNDEGRGVRGDLRSVFAAVWLDDEALDPANSQQPLFGKLSEPMLRLAQWARTFASEATRDRWRVQYQLRLSQSPLRAVSVFNFFRPGYVPPSSRLGTAGVTAPEFQITNEISVADYCNLMEGYIRDGVSNPSDLPDVPPAPPIQAEYARETPLAADSDRLLDRLNLLLCAGRLSEGSRRLIKDALREAQLVGDDLRRDPTLTLAKKRVQLAIFMVMISPDYVVRK